MENRGLYVEGDEKERIKFLTAYQEPSGCAVAHHYLNFNEYGLREMDSGRYGESFSIRHT